MDCAVSQEKDGSAINQGEGTRNGKCKDLTNIQEVESMRTSD